MRSHRRNYNTKSQNQTIKRVKVGKQTSRREKTNVGRVSVRLNAEACAHAVGVRLGRYGYNDLE